jgi:uncharacterized damage-inducible protein DinB
MYSLTDMARFALSEFERGLEGLTDEEARLRMAKANGTQMNSVTWTVGHLAWHWCRVRRAATGDAYPEALNQFANGSNDPTPPSLEDARGFLQLAKESTTWIAGADDELLARRNPRNPVSESVGTALMRVMLHTWFHAGEVNAIRQMLGHPEIQFVGPMIGNLEWQPA